MPSFSHCHVVQNCDTVTFHSRISLHLILVVYAKYEQYRYVHDKMIKYERTNVLAFFLHEKRVYSRFTSLLWGRVLFSLSSVIHI